MTESAPRVLGFDLSITSTGIAHPDGTTRTVRTRDADGDRRLQTIVDQVGIALTYGEHPASLFAGDVDLVVIEEAPPGLKGAAIKGIHMLHGAVRLHLLTVGVPYAVVNPAVLKAYATGDRGADKTAMAMAAYKRAGREFDGDKGGDQCDAWWLRAAGMDWLGHPEVALPKAQRDRLAHATWPIPRKDSAS